MRLLVQHHGKLLDLTHADEAAAGPYLASAEAVFVAAPDVGETVAHYPAKGKWLRGQQEAAESDLPDAWDLPGGKRLKRPKPPKTQPGQGRGKTAPQQGGKPAWRLASSTRQT